MFENKVAFVSVVVFLAIGLFLSVTLLQHRHRKVLIQAIRNPWAHGKASMKARGRYGLGGMPTTKDEHGYRHHFYSKYPRFVTVVLPSGVNAKGRGRRLHSIQQTWGPLARAIFMVHNESEFSDGVKHHAVLGPPKPTGTGTEYTSYPADRYSYPQIWKLPKDIGAEEGIPRLMYAIQTVFDRINPDFAFFVNDHTYVIPEHLCDYLHGLDPSHPLHAGHALKKGDTGDLVLNSESAGYLFSRATMQNLLHATTNQNHQDPNCIMSGNDTWLQGNPAVLITKCLQHSLHITAIDTREHAKYHRFHAFPLTRVVSGDLDEWYRTKHRNMPTWFTTAQAAQSTQTTQSTQSTPYEQLLSGLDCCARGTISFHYVEYKESKVLFKTREALLHNPHLKDAILKYLMITHWPTKHSEIGTHSRKLPHNNDHHAWDALLGVLRNISTPQTQRPC